MKKNTGTPTKAQLIAQMKQSADFKKKIAFARDTFYPKLLEANPTVDEAITWLSGFNSALMQAFLERMKEVKLSELKLGLKLNALDDRFLQFQKILELFDDMSVFDAKDHIEGLKGEIELWKRDEDQQRPLSKLPTKWIDEL